MTLIRGYGGILPHITIMSVSEFLSRADGEKNNLHINSIYTKSLYGCYLLLVKPI